MNVGKYPGDPPPKDTQAKKRKVPGGPKYSTAEVSLLLESLEIIIWTFKCGEDILKLDLELPEVADLVKEAIFNGQFKCSEWCSQNPDGPDAICDAYVLIRSEWNKSAHKYLECEYYVKLAINKGGNKILLVSCHT